MPKNTYDAGYKAFFRDPEMVASLLREFVHNDFIRDLDFSTFERCSGDYVSDDLRERFNDLVWRVRWKNTVAYVVILLEFQSTVDPWMAVRIQSYTALLWQDLIKTGAVNARDGLPPVFPIVLYTGQRPWTSAVDIFDLLAPEAKRGQLLAYLPHQRYFIIDEKGMQENVLHQCSGLTAQLFKLERARSPEEVTAVVQRLADQLHESKYDSLRHLFVEWLRRNVFQKCGFCEVPSELHDLQEAATMLAENLKEWQDNYKREVRKEVTAEVRKEVTADVRKEVTAEVRKEVTAEVRKEVTADVRKEARCSTLQNTVLRYLEQRFGASLSSAREYILQISDPDILDDLLVSLWKACSQQEALEEIRKRVH